MVGKAVDTIVWSNEASSMASIKPLKIVQIRLVGSSVSQDAGRQPWRRFISAMDDIEAEAVAGAGSGCLTVKIPLFIGPARRRPRDFPTDRHIV
jgi:hypothetical protein